jgi:hypothetical protein
MSMMIRDGAEEEAAMMMPTSPRGGGDAASGTKSETHSLHIYGQIDVDSGRRALFGSGMGFLVFHT